MSLKNQKNWIILNNEIMMKDPLGNFQLNKDKEAVRSYFLDNINKRITYFKTLEEKLRYLIDNKYYVDFLKVYKMSEIKKVYKLIESKKFRFPSYMSASKFYESYALKDDNGHNFLELYEDRIACVALFLAMDEEERLDKALDYAELLINQEYQPATPTFLNAGKVRAGELVSCFLDEYGDSLDNIGYSNNSAMHLSSIGGGVSFNLSKLRSRGEAIKGVEGRASGVLPIMKILEDTFSYANQLGQRDGAGAVYLNIFHADIMEFLDCKKINVDEKLRMKSLSIGIIIPDKFMELAEKDEHGYIFHPHTVYQEYGKYMDDMDFDNTDMYDQLVNNDKIKKTLINPRQLLVKIAQIQKESGYPYIFFKGNTNASNWLKNIGQVKFSNLCVKGDTKILTDKGYIEINEKVNQNVNIWNGEEWSNVKIVQTGIGQDLLNVKTDSGYELNATPYHKWYVVDTTKSKVEYTEKRTHELNKGDKLIKFELPTIDGNDILNKAYTNGFFSGDGVEYTGRDKSNKCYKKIYLYGDKKQLKDFIEYEGTWIDSVESRLSTNNIDGLKDKFFVPKSNYNIESRLNWLSGLIDSDGTLTNNNESYSIQIGSINSKFLKEVQLMLQTLGCDSKVTLARTERLEELPLNDGSGEYGLFKCKELHRLLINGNSLWKLKELGLKSNRLNLSNIGKPNRECSRFIKIVSVENLEGKHDTFCFTEEKRHMGMFNGILSGNCTEVLQVSDVSDVKPYGEQSDFKYGISCVLGSLNIANIMDNKNIKDGVKLAIRALSKVVDVTEIKKVPSIAKANNELRSIGLGAMNLHGFLAKNFIMYESEEAKEFVDKFFMMVNYYSLMGSMELSKEKQSPFVGFEGSDYANGVYFDTYLKDYTNKFKFEKIEKMFEDMPLPTLEEWRELQKEVETHGLYNAYRLTIAPNQSTSYIMNSTASIMPIVDPIEVREYGNSTTYYPMPYLNDENYFYYKSAYDMSQFRVMDLIATAQKHIDQGISCILHTNSEDNTRDLARYYIYAHKVGLKTLYYTRTRKSSISECISCSA